MSGALLGGLMLCASVVTIGLALLAARAPTLPPEPATPEPLVRVAVCSRTGRPTTHFTRRASEVSELLLFALEEEGVEMRKRERRSV